MKIRLLLPWIDFYKNDVIVLLVLHEEYLRIVLLGLPVLNKNGIIDVFQHVWLVLRANDFKDHCGLD